MNHMYNSIQGQVFAVPSGVRGRWSELTWVWPPGCCAAGGHTWTASRSGTSHWSGSKGFVWSTLFYVLHCCRFLFVCNVWYYNFTPLHLSVCPTRHILYVNLQYLAYNNVVYSKHLWAPSTYTQVCVCVRASVCICIHIYNEAHTVMICCANFW